MLAREVAGVEPGKDWRKTIESEVLRNGGTREEVNERIQNTLYLAGRAQRVTELMYGATAEKFVQDWSGTGDDAAEVFNTRFMRIVDGVLGHKGKESMGPLVTYEFLPRISSGYVRSFSNNTEKNPCYDVSEAIYAGENKFLKEVDKSGYKGEDERTMKYTRARVDTKSIKGDLQWAQWWYTDFFSKFWPLHDVMLSREVPDPIKVLDESTFNKVLNWCNKAEEQLGMKGSGVIASTFVLGMAGLAQSKENSKWGPAEYKKLKRLATETVYHNKDMPGNPETHFLDKEQWKWIDEQLDLRETIRRTRIYGGVNSFLGGKH